MRIKHFVWLLAIFALALFAGPATAQFSQQGPKLAGTGSVSFPTQGYAVALSADGNTLAVSGNQDNTSAGAVWIFTRSNGVWTQQGSKLVASGATGAAAVGGSLALSADGNTLLAGGTADNSNVGAAWVFTRSGATWTQQGPKLVASDSSGQSRQGRSVALSADGNTALIGGYSDNGFIGAAWVFTRSGTTWTQQGSKLVGTGANGAAQQGTAVALSGDGNTALIGGPQDGASTGAGWVFTRSGGVWSQQGSKLAGTGGVDGPFQGTAVALSADGNTALLGGYHDSAGFGATWVFVRNGGVWSQQGNKLVGTGAVGSAQQGISIALAGDGNTALIGGNTDNASAGAAWVFTRGGGTWTQLGNKLVGSGTAGPGAVEQGLSVAMSRDALTAAIGGPGDNGSIGAAWIFTTPGVIVSPAFDIAASGPLGGPFIPSTFNYTLTAANAGMTYTVTGTPTWLDASSTSGAINPAGTTITFTVKASANQLAVGTYGPTAIGITSSGGVGNTTRNATLSVGTVAATNVFVSAVLPGSRSVQVPTPATAFSTIINSGTDTAVQCSLAMGASLPATFLYQTTNPATNALTGTANTPVNIPPGGSQSFVFAITPSAAFSPTDVPIIAGCGNTTPAPSVVGLNTLLMSASSSPVPDVIALGATPTNDGIINVPNGGSGAFSVASANVGIGAPITVSADAGTATLPVELTLCQTNPSTATCTSAIGPNVTTTIAANATPTFSIFVKATGAITFDPANKRIFVRFKDAGGVTRGSTSVAVRTQ